MTTSLRLILSASLFGLAPISDTLAAGPTYYKASGWTVSIAGSRFAKSCQVASDDRQVTYQLWGRPQRLEIAFPVVNSSSLRAGTAGLTMEGRERQFQVPYTVRSDGLAVLHASAAVFSELGHVQRFHVTLSSRDYDLNAAIPSAVIKAYRTCMKEVRR